VIGPGAAVASGHAAIAAFWKGVIDSGIRDVALTTQDVASSGDLAAETGTVRLVAKDGAVTVDRYVVVWKRGDGRWRMFRDIWNAPK
jgi:ketosteroid isomerase-like protein